MCVHHKMGTTSSTNAGGAANNNAAANSHAAVPAPGQSPTHGGGNNHPVQQLQERRRSLPNRASIREHINAVLTGGTARRGMSDVGEVDDKGQLWVFIKAKTRQHNSNRITRKNVWFEAKSNEVMTVGRNEDCTLMLEDDRCAPINARIFATSNETVVLAADARMYRLIGMGFKPRSSVVQLAVGMVIKVGSVSLEVTSLCTKEGDNFLERFESELTSQAAIHPKKKNQSAKLIEGGGGDGHTPVGSLDTARALSTERDSMGGDGVTDQSEDEEDVVEAADEKDCPAVCYICWGGPDDPVGQDELSQVRRKGERRAPAERAGGAADSKDDPNPLIRNPCGKCSGSSRYVHLQCILTWIKSSGSGHCSICNGALPEHFASPPPNLELKVVRHRRGHSWVGTRRFRLSFADKPTATIGRDAEADVRLSDRSVCAVHARISFEKEEKRFTIQDCASVAGTYVQLMGQMELPLDEATYVKIGRTTLSVRLTQRRTSLIRSILPSLTARG